MSVMVIVPHPWSFRHYHGFGLLVCPQGAENDQENSAL